MTQEDKELLLKDLCTRLPYGVKCAIFDKKIEFGGFDGRYPFILDGITVETDGVDVWLEKANFSLETIKPYLRPMSSMTDKEQRYIWDKYGSSFVIADFEDVGDVSELFNYCLMNISKAHSFVDWLNARHFDYRGLIEKRLALEAPEDMYKN